MADGVSSSSDIADLVAWLRTASDREFTLEGEFRRRDPVLSAPTVRLSSPSRPGPTASWEQIAPDPTRSARRLRVWATTRRQIRVEARIDDELVELQLRDGHKWGSWSIEAGAATGYGAADPRSPPLVSVLVEPAQLLSSLRLDTCVGGSCAGRDTHTVEARPLERADRRRVFELEFDAEYGALLRSEVRRDGLVTSVSKAEWVAFDQVMPSHLFDTGLVVRLGQSRSAHLLPDIAGYWSPRDVRRFQSPGQPVPRLGPDAKVRQSGSGPAV